MPSSVFIFNVHPSDSRLSAECVSLTSQHRKDTHTDTQWDTANQLTLNSYEYRLKLWNFIYKFLFLKFYTTRIILSERCIALGHLYTHTHRQNIYFFFFFCEERLRLASCDKYAMFYACATEFTTHTHTHIHGAFLWQDKWLRCAHLNVKIDSHKLYEREREWEFFFSPFFFLRL